MARRKPPVIPDHLLDQLLGGADAKSAFETDGLLDELKKALSERTLNAEIDHHLDAGEADGRANSRNGYGKKRVHTRRAFERPHEYAAGSCDHLKRREAECIYPRYRWHPRRRHL